MDLITDYLLLKKKPAFNLKAGLQYIQGETM